MSYQPGIAIPEFYSPVSIITRTEARERSYNCNGYSRSVREDKFDFLELGSPSPILCQRYPTCPAVAEAVGHDDGCGVLLDRGDNEGRW